MKGSIERVRAVIGGALPDRAPLYELLRNDEDERRPTFVWATEDESRTAAWAGL